MNTYTVTVIRAHDAAAHTVTVQAETEGKAKSRAMCAAIDARPDVFKFSIDDHLSGRSLVRYEVANA